MQVVSSHAGNVPLATVVACYEAEFEPLPVDPEEGVPLEHLVSCVKGVLIQQGVTGIKSIIAVGGGGGEDDASAFMQGPNSIKSFKYFPPFLGPEQFALGQHEFLGVDRVRFPLRRFPQRRRPPRPSGPSPTSRRAARPLQ